MLRRLAFLSAVAAVPKHCTLANHGLEARVSRAGSPCHPLPVYRRGMRRIAASADPDIWCLAVTSVREENKLSTVIPADGLKLMELASSRIGARDGHVERGTTIGRRRVNVGDGRRLELFDGESLGVRSPPEGADSEISRSADTTV